jgi:hypothetical protein
MAHAIRVHKYGGPEVLQWDEIEVGPPGHSFPHVHQVTSL